MARKAGIGLVTGAALAFLTHAHAAPIEGSIGITLVPQLNGTGAENSQNTPGINLLNGLSLSFTSAQFSFPGTSNFAGSTTDPSIAPFTFVINPLDPISFSGTDGSFQATSPATVITDTATNFDVFFNGVFTPAGDLAAFGGNSASLNLSVNETINPSTGLGSVAGGATLAAPNMAPTPPSPVPEPAGVALVGIGMLGLGLVRRRRV